MTFFCSICLFIIGERKLPSFQQIRLNSLDMIKCIYISFITYGNFSFGIIAFSNFFTEKKEPRKNHKIFRYENYFSPTIIKLKMQKNFWTKAKRSSKNRSTKISHFFPNKLFKIFRRMVKTKIEKLPVEPITKCCHKTVWTNVTCPIPYGKARTYHVHSVNRIKSVFLIWYQPKPFEWKKITNKGAEFCHKSHNDCCCHANNLP